jgi:hypothetical protein
VTEYRVKVRWDGSEATAGSADLTRNLGRMNADVASQFARMNESVNRGLAFSGEKWAKYAMLPAQLSGNLDTLGIKSGLVSKSLTVFGDILSGAAGPGGAISLAVGAVGALAGEFIKAEQKAGEASKSTRTYLDLLIEYSKLKVDPNVSSSSRVTLNIERERLKKDIGDLESKISDKSMERGHEIREDQNFSPAAHFLHRPDIQVAKLTTELNDLTVQLDAARSAKEKLDEAFYGYPTTGIPNLYTPPKPKDPEQWGMPSQWWQGPEQPDQGSHAFDLGGARPGVFRDDIAPMFDLQKAIDGVRASEKELAEERKKKMAEYQSTIASVAGYAEGAFKSFFAASLHGFKGMADAMSVYFENMLFDLAAKKAALLFANAVLPGLGTAIGSGTGGDIGTGGDGWTVPTPDSGGNYGKSMDPYGAPGARFANLKRRAGR